MRETACGLPAALSLTLSDAVRVPLAVGLKVILMLQVAPAANELPHVWVCAKSPALVPVMAIPVMLMAVVPTLVSVTVFAGLVVPMATVPKFRLVGKSFAVVPIPPSVTCCGLPAALSLTLSAAVRVPLTVGLKVILILQVAPAANELPHV
jgi:Na+-transporting NADH:ubiquinone oxidoreductase subunit NqrE